MVSLIQKLYDCCLLCNEIWEYLTINDICQLLKVNNNVRTISLIIKEVICQKITINFYSFPVSQRQLTLQKIFHNFSNIYKLVVDTNEPMDINCMSVLYNTNSICNRLKGLSILLSNDNVGGLSNVRNLEILDCSYSPISNSNVFVEICLMKSLTSLDISHCIEINDEVLLPLSLMTSLISLNMQHCVLISNDGLQYLSTLTNLKHLDLSYGNNIDNSGLIFLIHLVNLKYLNLRTINISSLTFLESLVNITELDLSYSCRLSNYGFSSISCLTNLSFLRLTHCDLLTNNEGLCHLSKLFKLTSINLSNCRITSLSSLASLVNLTSLDLSLCCLLTDNGLSSISHLINLTYLDLSNSKVDVGFVYLSNLTKLKLLNLFCSNFSQLSFLNALLNITHLDLGLCYYITDKELKPISNLTNLQVLSLKRCGNLTYDGYQYLKTFPHLRNLDFGELIENNITNFVL